MLERTVLPAFSKVSRARTLTTLGLAAHRAGDATKASQLFGAASGILGKAADRIEGAHASGPTAYGAQNAFINTAEGATNALRQLSKDVVAGHANVEQSVFGITTAIGVARVNLSALRHEAYAVARGGLY
jgi:hypothetical protein